MFSGQLIIPLGVFHSWTLDAIVQTRMHRAFLLTLCFLVILFFESSITLFLTLKFLVSELGFKLSSSLIVVSSRKSPLSGPCYSAQRVLPLWILFEDML